MKSVAWTPWLLMRIFPSLQAASLVAKIPNSEFQVSWEERTQEGR